MKPNQRARKTGMLPGTLVHTGKQKMDIPKMTVIHYNQETSSKNEYQHVTSAPSVKKGEGVIWINVDGLHDVDQIQEIGSSFSLHPLLLEDVLSIDQRPKVVIYENCIFISLKMFHLKSNKLVDFEQISVILMENVVISFQEKEGDVFDVIRKSILENQGRIRKKNADFLVYRMLDVIVDNYFLIFDYFEEQIDLIEEQIDKGETLNFDKNIRELKKQVLSFRKDIRPLNESSLRLLKDDLELIEKTTNMYLIDVHDHLVQIIDGLDIQRENLTALSDQHTALEGMKLNRVMKLLTIVSTIFIPLTFIVGVYGMNFKNMPEISSQYGYFITWGVMLLITLLMIVLFKYKKWW